MIYIFLFEEAIASLGKRRECPVEKRRSKPETGRGFFYLDSL